MGLQTSSRSFSTNPWTKFKARPLHLKANWIVIAVYFEENYISNNTRVEWNGMRDLFDEKVMIKIKKNNNCYIYIYIYKLQRKSLRAICVTIISLELGGNEHIEAESKHDFLHGLLLRKSFRIPRGVRVVLIQ